MSAETVARSATSSQKIQHAWTYVSAGRRVSPRIDGTLSRFTSARMERIMHLLIGLGAAILGGQAFLEALGGVDSADTEQIALVVLVFTPLVAMILACAVGSGVRLASGAFAVCSAVTLLLWPFVLVPPRYGLDMQPWIFYLVGLSGLAAILAFPLRVQIAWAVVIPLEYGFVRLWQGNFQPEFWISTGFDVTFTLILCGMMVALSWLLRLVASGVDRARAQAIGEAGRRAAEAALEQERVAIAALMHDSVLAALLAADRAQSPRERDLAVVMAREALSRLANTEDFVAEEGGGHHVKTNCLAEQLRRVLSEYGADAVVEERGAPSHVPDRVARAFILAARQAIGNAIAHAGGRGLHLTLTVRSPVAGISDDAACGEGEIEVGIVDAGPGFELASVPEDRLGVRASIVARMTAVGGAADVDSALERGTSVILRWNPRSRAAEGLGR